MTTLKRAKTSQAVVDHVQTQIFEGRLRPGDRIDVDGVATALGVSPTPVREALTLLERDGVISKRVHRAAYIEHFDARTLRADFHVLGMLSGVAVARIAVDPDPEVLADLHRMLDELRAAPADAHARHEELSTEIRRAEHRAGATPRLRAELRGFGHFLEWAARQSTTRSRDELADAHAQVIDAIVAGDSRAASEHRQTEARSVAEAVIAELVQRGVIEHG
ncbi:GntR family transcriptional regulator [Aquihabitans sp. McL0605]|uniref:GntR family transcriptional regulator n=1 Tax=Aquihabitans sp. McL0605 TaxID=3415671 RepID=UPI003CF86318